MSLASRLAKLAVRALEGTAEREAAPVVRRAAAAPLAVRKALPAPPKVLALPAPKPKSLAAKPRGGQCYPDLPLAARDARAAGYKVRDRGEAADIGMRYQVVRPGGEGTSAHGSQPEFAWRLAEQRHAMDAARANLSPEAAARAAREDAALSLIDWVPEGEVAAGPGPGARLGDWLEKTLAKYYKTDFGTEADPLSDLAARGLHYDPDMTPERWLDTANSSLMEDPIGYYTVPRHASEIAAEHNPPPFTNDFAGDVADTAHHLAPGLSFYGNANPIGQGALMQAAPWLRKQPATDMLYGIKSPLDLGHFADEMRNAMNAAESGIPPDLAVRPEMLERMSFPQAVERVGRINQFRVKQMEAERAAQMNNPAIHPFKEYPEGMRWVELRAPDPAERFKLQPVEENGASFWRATDPETGETWPLGGTREQAIDSLRYHVREPLQQALKAEGDTMGHCVGGYCDDVLTGRSRSFSLRDAKGTAPVTVETSRPNFGSNWAGLRLQLPEDAYDTLSDEAMDTLRGRGDDRVWDAEGNLSNFGREEYDRIRDIEAQRWLQTNNPEDIVQIKGKQNRAPNPEYLPFVQDFVKSGQWGDIGDLRNAGLTYLPDRRLISLDDLDRVAQSPQALELFKGDAEAAAKNLSPWNLNTFSVKDWDQTKHLFEGYARGGLAVKKCGCMQCGGLAVKRAA